MSRILTSICARRIGTTLVILLLPVSLGRGQNERQRGPEPTYRNVPYGSHERNVVDFYQANSDQPTPVLAYFHGGGFRGGDKRRINAMLYWLCMDGGISFAAANYRLSQQAPYPAQMHDSARAVQLLRSKATQWNIDPKRIAAFGGSAGAGISLWLAFHDDMADPDSADIIDRQSTRLSCAVGLQAQSTYDPREIKTVVPGNAYDHPALKQLFGVGPNWDWDQDAIDDALSAKMKDASPVNHLSNDDPPVFVYHRKQQDVPGNIHHANFGRYLKKRMDALGINCIRRMSTDYGDEQEQNEAIFEFISRHLGKEPQQSKTGQPAFRFREDENRHAVVIRVDAGDQDRIDALVSIPLERVGGGVGDFQLVQRTDADTVLVPAQIERGPAPRLWWVLRGKTRAGQTCTFELRTVKADPPTLQSGSRVDVHETDRSLEIRIGGKSVARYNSAHVDAPPGVDPSYGRSAHLHPLWTPTGKLVTDQFPPDHLHQSGIFLAFTKTEFEGRAPNFWDLKGGTGRVRFHQTLAKSSGPVFGGFRIEHEHMDLTAKAPTVALRETWDVRVWNPHQRDANYWVMDIVSTIRCATEHPLTVKEYHYGGMAIRAARPWKTDACQFLTSNGNSRANGNHARAKWVDIGGPVGGEQAGVTIMTHPDNLRFPEPVRIHPTMPYMVFTPAVVGDWTIQPGTHHVTRYRYVVHDGQVDPSVADRLWYDYAHPCRVRRIP